MQVAGRRDLTVTVVENAPSVTATTTGAGSEDTVAEDITPYFPSDDPVLDPTADRRYKYAFLRSATRSTRTISTSSSIMQIKR